MYGIAIVVDSSFAGAACSTRRVWGMDMELCMISRDHSFFEYLLKAVLTNALFGL
jgi:hypothetical protein